MGTTNQVRPGVPDAELTRDELAARYENLAWKVANRVARPPTLPLDDVFQEAMIAVWQAAARWEPGRERCTPFRTFAWFAAERAVRRFCMVERRRGVVNCGDSPQARHRKPTPELAGGLGRGSRADYPEPPDTPPWSDYQWGRLLGCLTAPERSAVNAVYRRGIGPTKYAARRGLSRQAADRRLLAAYRRIKVYFPELIDELGG